MGTLLSKLKTFKVNKKVYIFTICLILSTLFWSLNNLTRDDFKVTIDFPVKFQNFNKNKIITSSLPKKISVKIKGLGFKLLVYKIKRGLNPITLDFSNIIHTNTENKSNHVVVMRSLYAEINSQIGNNFKAVSASPDTLYFQLENLVTKTIPIKINTKLTFKKQYQLTKEVEFKPSSAKVTGPKSILDTIPYLYSDTLIMNNLDKEIVQKLSFSSYSSLKYLSIQPKNISILLSVEKFTEARIRIPIQSVNFPENLTVKTFPRDIDITFILPLSKYNAITKSMFNAVIDYNDIIVNKDKLALKVQLTKTPSYIRFVRFKPQEVEYIIRK